jgi:hypothetical protein
MLTTNPVQKVVARAAGQGTGPVQGSQRPRCGDSPTHRGHAGSGCWLDRDLRELSPRTWRARRPGGRQARRHEPVELHCHRSIEARPRTRIIEVLTRGLLMTVEFEHAIVARSSLLATLRNTAGVDTGLAKRVHKSGRLGEVARGIESLEPSGARSKPRLSLVVLLRRTCRAVIQAR